MSKTIRRYDRFRFFDEDCLCEYCLHNTKKGKGKKHGCRTDACLNKGIRADAFTHGRASRERGRNK